MYSLSSLLLLLFLLGSPLGVGGGLVQVTNPILTGDLPDPHVLRDEDRWGNVKYYLTATVGDGDFPVYTSKDLIHWTKLPSGLFNRTINRRNAFLLIYLLQVLLQLPDIRWK